MSRIHDALKKAEAERARATNGSPSHNGELPSLAISPLSDPGTDCQTADLENPLPVSKIDWPLNLDKATGPSNGTSDRQNWNIESSAATCEASLLKQCAQYSLASTHDNVLLTDRSKYRIGAEEFRTLRSTLDLVRKQRPLKTLLITSALPGEGKTFIAVNLAHALAWRHDQRVLLVDADLRLSRVHNCFINMPQEPGLADYLISDLDPLSLIRRGPGDNFFVLPAGRTVPNALEVVGNGRLKSLKEWLAPAFDWVIIDSPPAVPVSDARLIAEYTDGVLFVVRAGRTPSGLAKRTVRQIRGKRYLGVVLNGIEADLSASSYYYGGKNGAASRKYSS